MQNPKLNRNLVIVLLLCSALTTGLIPNGSSQEFTTTSSFLTNSLTQMTTYYSESYYAETSTGTGTLTKTASFTNQGNGCVAAYNILVNAAGETHVEYSVGGLMNSELVLDVLNWSSTKAWLASPFLWTSPCDPVPLLYPPEGILYHEVFDPILYPPYSISGSFDFNLPTSGNPYMFFLETRSTGLAVTLSISPVLTTQTMTSAISIPVTVTTSGTTTLTYYSTLEVSPNQTYGDWIVAVVIGALVVAVLFLALRKRSKHTPEEETQVR